MASSPQKMKRDYFCCCQQHQQLSLVSKWCFKNFLFDLFHKWMFGRPFILLKLSGNWHPWTSSFFRPTQGWAQYGADCKLFFMVCWNSELVLTLRPPPLFLTSASFCQYSPFLTWQYNFHPRSPGQCCDAPVSYSFIPDPVRSGVYF